jgi:hypothetical protein
MTRPSSTAGPAKGHDRGPFAGSMPASLRGPTIEACVDAAVGGVLAACAAVA